MIRKSSWRSLLTAIVYVLVTVVVLILAGSSGVLQRADVIDGGARSAVIFSGVALLLFGVGRQIFRTVRRARKQR